MQTYKFSGQINVVFSELEIEANSLEEAKEELLKMDALSIVQDACVDDSDIVEQEVKLTTARLTFKISNIKYDIDEDDLDDGKTVEDVLKELPKELFISVEYGYDFDCYDYLEDTLTDMVSDETGYCVKNFKYEINPEQEKILEEIKNN